MKKWLKRAGALVGALMALWIVLLALPFTRRAMAQSSYRDVFIPAPFRLVFGGGSSPNDPVLQAGPNGTLLLNGTAIGSGGGITALGGNTFVVPNTTYGIKADTQIFYSGITATSGLSTIGCSSCTFTNADIGKNIEVVLGGGSGGSGMGTGLIASTAANTITSIVNATTVSIAPAVNAQTCGTCQMAYGTNDDAGWTALNLAMDNLPTCSTIYLHGFSMVKEPHINQAGSTHVCVNTTTAHDYNHRVVGDGPYNSGFVLQDNYDFAACTFTSSNDGCNFTYSQMVLDNFAVTGIGFGPVGTVNKRLIAPGQGSQASDLNLMAFASTAGTGTTGITFSSGLRAKFVSCDGFGNICGNTRSVGTPAFNYCFWCFFGDTVGPNLQIDSDTFIDYGSEYGVTAGTAALRINGGTYYGYGGSAFPTASAVTGTAGGCALYNLGGTAVLFGGNWDNSGATNGNGICVQNPAATLSMEGVTAKGTGTGGSVNVITGTFFDRGNNTYASQALIATGVSVQGPGTLAGSCSGVGTASSTLGLFNLGQYSALTCTSTTTTLGQVMDQPGTLEALLVTATAAGTNASSGVVTVLKNGSPTTITCTIGTGTSCKDSAHATAYVLGDVISVQFTTQVADTLAGVKAVILKQ